MLAAALAAAALWLSLVQCSRVAMSQRIQFFLNRASSSLHQDCVCNVLAFTSTKPSVLSCASRVLRSTAFVKM